MIPEFSVSRYTINFKIAIVALTNQYLKMENSSLSLYFLKKHTKPTKEICEKNAREFG